MEKREVVFVEGMRTAFGRLGGSLKDYTFGSCCGGGQGVVTIIENLKR